MRENKRSSCAPLLRRDEERREMVKGEEMTGKEDRERRDEAFQNLGTSFLHRFVLIIVICKVTTVLA